MFPYLVHCEIYSNEYSEIMNLLLDCEKENKLLLFRNGGCNTFYDIINFRRMNET